jgi:WD40 repeat protein
LNQRKELSSTTVDAPAAKLHASRAFVGPFSPDGKWLAVCPGDGAVGLVEIGNASHSRIKTTFPKINASTLAFSPDSRTFVMVPAASGRLLAHDLHTGQERRFGVDTAYIHLLAFSPDGSLLAVAGWNRTLLLVDAGPLRPDALASKADAVPLKAHWVRAEPRGDITALAFTPDGKTLGSGGSDGAGKLWNTGTGDVRESLTGHAGGIRALAFSADGRSLFTAGAEGTVKVRRVSE